MSTQTILDRLQQTRNHFSQTQPAENEELSLLHGDIDTPLVYLTLGELLDEQAEIYGDSECLIVSSTKARWTYSDIQAHSLILARGLLKLGIEHGDRIGILAGNCEEYVATFFAAGYVGAILVVLNSTYTAAEAHHALNHSGELATIIEVCTIY